MLFPDIGGSGIEFYGCFMMNLSLLVEFVEVIVNLIQFM
jgi:hypothetical protein